MTRSDLLDIVYRFYPRGLMEGALGYWESEEHARLVDAARRGAADYPRFKAVVRRLGERYPFWDYSTYLLGESWEPAYTAFIWIPGYRIGFHVSLLAPYYGIHRLGAPSEEEAALDIARQIEAAYPGYEPIPPELGEDVVPDVVYFDHTTIYECLLGRDWKRSSGPDDGKRSPIMSSPGPKRRSPTPAPPTSRTSRSLRSRIQRSEELNRGPDGACF
jgi:hypothetical protein